MQKILIQIGVALANLLGKKLWDKAKEWLKNKKSEKVVDRDREKVDAAIKVIKEKLKKGEPISAADRQRLRDANRGLNSNF